MLSPYYVAQRATALVGRLRCSHNGYRYSATAPCSEHQKALLHCEFLLLVPADLLELGGLLLLDEGYGVLADAVLPLPLFRFRFSK